MSIVIIGGLVPLVLWGVNALFEKKAVTGSNVWNPLFYVHIFLVPLGLIPAVVVGDLPDFNLKFFVFITIFAFFDFIGMYLFYKGFSISKVGIITPITSSYAVITTIVSVAIFGEVLGVAQFGLILVIVFGIIVLSVNPKDWKNADRSDLIGALYALVIFMIYGVWVPLWDQFISQGGYLYILTVDRLIILFLVLVVARYKKADLKPKKSILSWVFLSAVTLVIANGVYNWALFESDETSLIAAISSAYPLAAVLTTYFFLKEKLTTRQYIGMMIIVIGVVLLSIV